MAKMTFAGNQRSAPVWFADFTGREHLALFPAKIDPAAFADAAAVVVTTTGAVLGATAVPVAALTAPGYPSTISINNQVLIPAGTTLYFGGAKVATLTADAKIGDTSLAVAALPTALVNGDSARYSRFGGVFIPSGTLVGRTFAERTANTPFGVADVAGPDDELYLTAFDVVDARENNDVELVRHGVRIKENYLPNFATLSAPTLTKIRSLYECQLGND